MASGPGYQQKGTVGSSKVPSLHRNIELSSKNRINFVRILEGSKRFTATKGTLKHKKGKIKMEGKFCAF